MAVPNVFQELKSALTELKTFLDGPTVAAIKGAIHTIAGVVPQINSVIDELLGLLGKLDLAIQNLNVDTIGGPVLEKVTTFTKSIKSILETAKTVLPNETAKIDEVISGLDLVGGLPSVKDLKDELHKLLTEIIDTLKGFKG